MRTRRTVSAYLGIARCLRLSTLDPKSFLCRFAVRFVSNSFICRFYAFAPGWQGPLRPSSSLATRHSPLNRLLSSTYNLPLQQPICFHNLLRCPGVGPYRRGRCFQLSASDCGLGRGPTDLTRRDDNFRNDSAEPALRDSGGCIGQPSGPQQSATFLPRRHRSTHPGWCTRIRDNRHCADDSPSRRARSGESASPCIEGNWYARPRCKCSLHTQSADQLQARFGAPDAAFPVAFEAYLSA